MRWARPSHSPRSACPIARTSRVSGPGPRFRAAAREADALRGLALGRPEEPEREPEDVRPDPRVLDPFVADAAAERDELDRPEEDATVRPPDDVRGRAGPAGVRLAIL